MNIIIGQAARGEDFFSRQKITDEIWAKLSSGSNVLLVAPRRVGKSSILFDLLDNSKEGYIIIYYTSESVNNPNEFYKKLFNHINEKFSSIRKYKNKVEGFTKNLLSRIDSFSIKNVSVTLGESKISFRDEVIKILEKLELENERLIILIDEFAQTVENIIEDENERTAIKFLETKRELRLLPEFHKKVQFVYAGSIGLENVVSRFNGIKFVNDLTSISVPPLTEKEAGEFVNKILDERGLTFNKGAFEHLLQRIEWLIPFYFQIILDGCKKNLKGKGASIITNEIIDSAFDNTLKQRIYFEHWFTRLRTAFKGDDFSFVKDVLNIISGKKSFKSEEIFDLAVKHKLEKSYNDIINALKYDGYINNNDDPKTYRFNSPLLKEWWYRNVAN